MVTSILFIQQNGNSFEVNRRVIYSMRACGRGYGLEKFNFCMNLPKPMTRANYNIMSYTIRIACKETALGTMNEAAHNF